MDQNKAVSQGASASQTGLPPASRAEPVVSGIAGIPSAELAAAASLVPEGLPWSVGTGTKRSHAQILPDGLIGRRHSFYATADTEAEALRIAATEAREFVRGMHERVARR